MSKFKIGDKVKVVKEYHGGLVRRLGDTYTVDKIVDAQGMCGVYVNDEPSWLADEYYELVTTAHKHAELIKQWADNPNIKLQFRGSGCQIYCWYTMTTPDWRHDEIRIKPEPKPDIIRYLKANLSGNLYQGWSFAEPVTACNIKAIFDGETGNIKSVEMI